MRQAPDLALEARNIRAALGGAEVLHGISFALPAGTRLGIVGREASAPTPSEPGLHGALIHPITHHHHQPHHRAATVITIPTNLHTHPLVSLSAAGTHP